MKTLLLALLFTSPLLADSNASLPPYPYESEGGMKSPVFSDANAQAISWLTLMDQGQYGATWSQGGSLLKDIITQDQWVTAMEGIRKPLGNASTRKAGSSETTQTLSGGTKGNFIIISYQTSFSNKPFLNEKVTMMTNSLNQWAVISYDISSK